jgi:hypothetical protein
MASVATTDVTVATIDEMDPIHGGIARRARAQLGVTAWGMQVLTLPPSWRDYPYHNHDEAAFDPNQEEVSGEQRFDLVPGTMARVGPKQLRQILPGPEGIRLLALGGRPGSFDAPPWTELGAPPPGAE